MPEWPEVEFCRQRLREWAEGQIIADVWAGEGPPLRGQAPAELHRRIQGRRIEKIRRKGKQLAWQLSGEMVLLVHLGMTGKWLLQSCHQVRHRHVRASLVLGGTSSRLDFFDPRKFGRIRSIDALGWERTPEWLGLGPDAMVLAGDPRAFAARVGGRKGSIKSVLMDQKVLSGVGNIYAAEALFMARLNPRTPSVKLESRALESLGEALVEAMQSSLKRERGDQIRYLQDARSTNPFLVYGREGEGCPGCEHCVFRFQQHGRSTFWCPACQGESESP